jgi:uncharacterized repeat protein (TIGR01451 family)
MTAFSADTSGRRFVVNTRISRLGVGMLVAGLVGATLGVAPVLATTPASVTFGYTHAEQQFDVPAGVSDIHVALVGGHGGLGATGTPSRGAIVSGDLAVTAGTTIFVEVAGNGNYIVGGFNGGGNSFDFGGGGGASDIRTASRSDAGSMGTRLMVAAGGGGQGGSGNGGDAGSAGQANTAGSALGGGAGTNVSGGVGGANLGFGASGADGSAGQGGAGGGTFGAGGGGGLFGGGGGADGAGGGGGSSYLGTATNTSVALDETGVPSITITYSLPGIPGFGVVGASSVSSSALSVTFDAIPNAAEATILANYSVPGLTLSGTPALVGSTVTIASSAQVGQSYTVTVSNVTRASDAFALTTNSASFTGTPAAATPQVQLSTSSLNFGSVAVGASSASQLLTVSNVGTDALSVAAVSITGTNASDFVRDADACSGASVAAGSSCTVSVSFRPSGRGVRSAMLRLSDNAADTPQSVALTGTGVAPIAQVAPASIDFGTLAVGSPSGHRTVTITNIGDAGQTLSPSSAQITGANAADFAMVADTCVATGAQLASGSSCTIDLIFTPGAAGPRSASLTLGDNGLGSPHTVALTGAGGTPSSDLAVSISASPNPVKTGQKVTYTITVLNAGPSTASTIVINDSLSSQSTFVSATITGGTCVTPKAGASGVVSCSLASLASGSSKPIQIVVTVIAKKTSITNTVTVSAATADPNLANNTASITTRLK